MKAMCVALAGMLGLAGCGRTDASFGTANRAASLPASFNFGRLGLKTLTSFVNRRQATTATLYANDLARQAAVAGTGAVPAGGVLALLTWQQQDDARWLGGRIPGALLRAELLKAVAGPAGRPTLTYQRFEGPQLTPSADTLHRRERIAFLLAQQPSVLP